MFCFSFLCPTGITQREHWTLSRTALRPSRHISVILSEEGKVFQMLTRLLTMPRRFLGSLHDKLERRGKVFTICSFQAYFGDSYNSLHLYRSYTSPSHSYLRIQTPVTPLEVRLRSDGTSECGSEQHGQNITALENNVKSLSAPVSGRLTCAASC